MEGALWSNDALRGQLVDATSVLDPLLGDAAARLLRPDPKRRMTAEQLRLLLSGVQVAEEAVDEVVVEEEGVDEDVMCLLRGLGLADDKFVNIFVYDIGILSIDQFEGISAQDIKTAKQPGGFTVVQAKHIVNRFDAEMRVRELADAAAAKAGHGDEAGALGACLIAADELVRLSPLMPSVGTKVQACRAKLAQVEEAELSAAEQKKQNEALYCAARDGEMGKFKAAIAAGAEVDWHDPYVSELSELE